MREKNWHSASCAKLFMDPKSKIFLWNVAFLLAAGHQKILTVTLKWVKQILFYIFKGFALNKIVNFLKAENEEKLKTKFLIQFFKSKIVVPIFGNNIFSKQILISNLIFWDCSLMYV